MKKFFLASLTFLTITNAFSKPSNKKYTPIQTKKSTQTNSKANTGWPIELKAEINENLVIKDKQPILHVDLKKEDEVNIKVLAKSFAADPAVWKFLVRTRAGRSVKIDYDAASKVWFFKREDSKQYTVFVSKRKNNTETIPWLWFEL